MRHTYGAVVTPLENGLWVALSPCPGTAGYSPASSVPPIVDSRVGRPAGFDIRPCTATDIRLCRDPRDWRCFGWAGQPVLGSVGGWDGVELGQQPEVVGDHRDRGDEAVLDGEDVDGADLDLSAGRRDGAQR